MSNRDKLQDALEFHKQGEAAAAIKLYEEILHQEPNNAAVHHLLGILHAQRNDYTNAKKYLQKALELEADNPSFHNSMGNILKNLGDFDGALSHYQQALKIKPDYAVASNSIGNIYLKHGELAKAKSYYQKALQLQPNYPDAHYNLAIILLKQELPEEAMQQLDETLRLDPEHVEANNQKGQLLHQQGNLEEAIEYYQKALQYDPLNPELFHNLGTIFLEQRKPDLALKYFLRLLQLAPDFEVYYNLGLIYMVQDRLNDAVQYFNEALKLKPNDLATHQNLGVIFIRAEDYPKAIHHYQEAARIAPDDKEIKYTLDALSGEQGQTEAPKEYIQHLFDQYAPHFDKHLTTMLDYKAPTLLYEAVIEELITAEKLIILDLGCGTGLAGEKFKPLAKKLIGIDLSSQMIEVAKEKNLYDELAVLDINEALTKYKDLDLIIAADTIVYSGNLIEIFSNCAKSLKPSGLFAFTIEKTYNYPYELQKSARFAHSKQYIEELAISNNFEIIRLSNVTLRKQQNQPIEGYLYILLKKELS